MWKSYYTGHTTLLKYPSMLCGRYRGTEDGLAASVWWEIYADSSTYYLLILNRGVGRAD